MNLIECIPNKSRIQGGSKCLNGQFRAAIRRASAGYSTFQSARSLSILFQNRYVTRSRTLSILLTAALTACSASDDGQPALTTDSTATPPPSDSIAGIWTVNEKGFGPVEAGITVAEANRRLRGILVVPAKLEQCDYVRPKTAPRHVAFMVENGIIARLDVRDSSTVTTSTGARVGDSEARIKSLYPGRVTVGPHKYTDGHYLVVTPANAADSAFRIVFETDGSKVLRFRSGRRPAVEYVEGCA